MFRIVALQLLMVSIAVFGAAWFAGYRFAVSTLWGALACVLPAFVLACTLNWVRHRQPAERVGWFMLGVMIKLGLTLGILVLAPFVYSGLTWGGLMFGLAVGLHAYLLVFLVRTS